eukprot:6198454-Pleurochrysis_carterae.AAC.1
MSKSNKVALPCGFLLCFASEFSVNGWLSFRRFAPPPAGSERYGMPSLPFGLKIGLNVSLGETASVLNAVASKPGCPPQAMLSVPCNAWVISVLLGGVYNKTRS